MQHRTKIKVSLYPVTSNTHPDEVNAENGENNSKKKAPSLAHENDQPWLLEKTASIPSIKLSITSRHRREPAM